jgi:hypothetical protein
MRLSIARLCQWGPTRYGKSGREYPMTSSIAKGAFATQRVINRTKLLGNQYNRMGGTHGTMQALFVKHL